MRPAFHPPVLLAILTIGINLLQCQEPQNVQIASELGREVLSVQKLAPQSEISSSEKGEDKKTTSAVAPSAPSQWVGGARGSDLLLRIFAPLTDSRLSQTEGLRNMWLQTYAIQSLQRLIDSLDEDRLEQMIQNWTRINEKLEAVTKTYTRNVTGVDEKLLLSFYNALAFRLDSANDRIVFSLAAILDEDVRVRILKDIPEEMRLVSASALDVVTNFFVEVILQAQRDLLLIMQVIEEFYNGQLVSLGTVDLADGTARLYYYQKRTQPEVSKIQLTLRPWKSEKGPAMGEARMGWEVYTARPERDGFSEKVSCRVDLARISDQERALLAIPPEITTEIALDLDSHMLNNLNIIGANVFRWGHHYPFPHNFSDPQFFANLVNGYIPFVADEGALFRQKKALESAI